MSHVTVTLQLIFRVMHEDKQNTSIFKKSVGTVSKMYETQKR